MRALSLVLMMGVTAVATPLKADDVALYDLSIRGLKVAELSLSSDTSPRQYAVKGNIRNTGLTRVVRKITYTGSARGAIKGNRLVPKTYEEVANTDDFETTVKIRYSNGVPNQVSYSSERERTPDSPNPKSLKGVLDPLAGIFGLLRDVPLDRGCRYDVQIYDGARLSRLFMRPAGSSGGLPTCQGAYLRLKGYTPDEVARHTQFNFTMTYRDAGNGKIAADVVVFDTVYGNARVSRR